jgi:molybdopterin/thiamine biosynthesis adenylyltransferase
LGNPKVQSVAEKVAAMNPDVRVETFQVFLTRENAADFLAGCDFIIEASDNHATKFLVNDACVHFHIPFVVAGVVQYYGQVVSVIPGETACYRCIFHEPAPQGSLPTCSGTGVLGTVPALGGILQAHEAIFSILGIPSKMTNQLFSFDLLASSFEHIMIRQDPSCLACSNPEDAFYLTADYGTMPETCEL